MLSARSATVILLSLHEHAISVGVEAVSGLDRVAVSVHDQFLAAQRAYQHQQSGLRQMKVGQQRVYDAESVAGIDEICPLRRARLLLDLAVRFGALLQLARLQCADGGCAHGDHAPPLGFRLVDRSRRLG